MVCSHSAVQSHKWNIYSLFSLNLPHPYRRLSIRLKQQEQQYVAVLMKVPEGTAAPPSTEEELVMKKLGQKPQEQ